MKNMKTGQRCLGFVLVFAVHLKEYLVQKQQVCCMIRFNTIHQTTSSHLIIVPFLPSIFSNCLLFIVYCLYSMIMIIIYAIAIYY